MVAELAAKASVDEASLAATALATASLTEMCWWEAAVAFVAEAS